MQSAPPRQGATLAEPAEDKLTKRPRRKNFYQKVDLMCYCLMPNHFHLLIRQNRPPSVTEFMRSVSTAYSMYFNKKYKRVGSLFQGIFKAVDIKDEPYLLWVSRYIHRNPENFSSFLYSSYADYLGKRQTGWLNTTILLDYFGKHRSRQEKSYQEFTEGAKEEPIDLATLMLESEETS